MSTIPQYISEYLLYHRLEKNSRDKTIAWHQQCLNTFKDYVDKMYPDNPAEHIKENSIRQYFAYLIQERKNQPQTLLNRYIELKAFFNFMLSREYITKSPMQKIVRPRVDKKMPQHLPPAEIKKLWKYLASRRQKHYRLCYVRDMAIMGVLCYAGLRRSELLGLTMQDVDLENRLIKLPHTKSRQGQSVPISRSLLELLQSYMAIRITLKRETSAFFVSANRSGRNRKHGDGSFGVHGLLSYSASLTTRRD